MTSCSLRKDLRLFSGPLLGFEGSFSLSMITCSPAFRIWAVILFYSLWRCHRISIPTSEFPGNGVSDNFT